MGQYNAVNKWGPFPSRSEPGKNYYVQLNDTGIVSCNCKGWAIYKGRARSCPHTAEIIANEGLAVVIDGHYLVVRDRNIVEAYRVAKLHPDAQFQALLDSYEAAFQHMVVQKPKAMLQAAVAVQELKFKIESHLLVLRSRGIDVTAKLDAVEQRLGR